MAEILLDVSVEAVIRKAFSLAGELISGAWGVHEDLRRLAEQLDMIQALLSDAENKSTSSRAIKLWLKKLKDAATDADCLLDEFAYEVVRKKIEEPKLWNEVRNFCSPSNPLAFRCKMASKIKKINSRLDGIFEESDRIGLISQSNQITNSSFGIRRDRITDPFVKDSEIFGRVDEAEEILRTLNSSQDETDLSVIAIVGMAGQGKTTLAQLVYNKEEMTRCFEKKIWLCVSDDFDVERILNEMLQSLTGNVSTRTMADVIVRELEKELKGKRFLLVLDDVWNEDAEKWSRLQNCLHKIGGSRGSKIIVTTRIEGVVVSIMRAKHVHRLGALSEEDSWRLLEKRAFTYGEAENAPELVKIGKEIVKRCGGLPLAIKALGGLMYSKRNVSEWTKIAESNIWGSLDAQPDVLSIVKLSYDYLPSLSLKQCFAYCAIFQKDSILNRELLIQQWMAHGWLNPCQGSNLEMEDVGNNYFKALLQRSLFQDAELDEFGNVNSCKMHDVVHDFALEASRDWCLTVDGGSKSEDMKVVHLSITSDRSESLDATAKTLSRYATAKTLSRLRTLFLYQQEKKSFSLDELAKCKHLCVLVLCCDIEALPDSVVRLKHLRCLDLYNTNITTLSSSITKLYNVQTLRLRKLGKLPREFGNLVKLRHLHFDHLDDNASLLGIDKLISLRTLPCFIVIRGDSRCQIGELGFLKNLEGSLKIYGLENVSNHEEAKEADLSTKRNLEYLEFHWGDNTGPACNYNDVLEGLKPHPNLKVLKIRNFVGESLPSWMMMSTNHQLRLRRLELKDLNSCQQVPVLGHLPYLEVVHIEGMKSVKYIGNGFYGWTSDQSRGAAFSSLKELHLIGMTKLEEWFDPSPTVYQSHEAIFPVLESLRVHNAPELTNIPKSMFAISSLKRLEIFDCYKLGHLSEGLSLPHLVTLDIRRTGLLSIPDLQGLQSLGELTIKECHKLGSIPKGLEACLKLESLDFGDCASVRIEDLRCPSGLQKLTLGVSEDVDCEDFPLPRNLTSLAHLNYLVLGGNSKVKSLSEQIQHLPVLRYLELYYFGGMEALPEWLCNIPSLRELGVTKWEKLAHLPSRESLERLTTSCLVTFSLCPILEKMYEEGSSPEWDKIANPPNIDFETVRLRRTLLLLERNPTLVRSLLS